MNKAPTVPSTGAAHDVVWKKVGSREPAHHVRMTLTGTGTDRFTAIVTAPEPLRDSLRGRPWRQQVHACAALLAMPSDPVEHRATVRALGLTAQRVLAARHDAKQLEAELRQLITVMAPALLSQPGIGPVSAAQLLISWSHPGRFRSEAAFAMLAGAAPVPAFLRSAAMLDALAPDFILRIGDPPTPRSLNISFNQGEYGQQDQVMNRPRNYRDQDERERHQRRSQRQPDRRRHPLHLASSFLPIVMRWRRPTGQRGRGPQPLGVRLPAHRVSIAALQCPDRTAGCRAVQRF